MSNVCLFNFDRKVPASPEFIKYDAFNTAEVPYVFDNLKFLLNRPLEPADDLPNKLILGYWVNFIKTGDPNGEGLWPQYTKSKS